MFYPVFTCWSFWVKAETNAVRLEIILHCDIIVYLSAVVAVSSLTRASCVPSISLMLFAMWYPPAQVDTFCFLLYFRCAAWKCAWKFAQFFFPRCLSSHLSAVVIEQARVVHKRVYCVDGVFVGDRPSSIICKLLYFLDPLHQFLDWSDCVPRLRHFRAISHEVLVFHLSVRCE